MKIQKIKLRGFIGIKKGMGLDEVSLDLSDLSGLVGFDGPNGMGKTTVLDNMHPFRTLASRKKALQHHVFLRDSTRELAWTMDGHAYETILKIDAQTGKQEGYIIKDGVSQVDGKCPEYDRYITDLLGSPNLFFNSVFCAQNSARISDMTTGQLKELFSEFLRLDVLVKHEQTAKEVLLVLKSKDDQIEVEKDRLAHSIRELTDSDVPVEDQITQNNLKRLKLDTALRNRMTDLADLEGSLKQAEKATLENKGILARIDDNLNMLQEVMSDKKALQAEINNGNTETNTELNEIQEQINSFQNILGDKDEIMSAVIREKECLEEIKKIHKRDEGNTKLSNDIMVTIDKLREKRQTLTSDLTDLERQYSTAALESKKSILRDQMKTLDLRKDDPGCPAKDAVCVFVKKAVEASNALPALESEIKHNEATLQAESIKIRNKLASIKEQAESHLAQRSQLSVYHEEDLSKIKALETEYEKVKTVALKASQLTEATTKIDALTEGRKRIEEAREKKRKEWQHREAELEARRQTIEETVKTLKESLDRGAEERAAKILDDIETVRLDIKAIEGLIADIDSDIRRLEEIEHDIKRDTERLNLLQEAKSRVLDEISDWSYLRHALSKDGLRALEIDSVAPAISGYANDLLAKTFGPSFSVRFLTQDEETGREILDIIVIREDGSEVLLDNLSGGEKVWLLKSLRLAMTLISKERSGRDYLTLLCDEEDGALSRENAVNFILLYRTLLKMAGMETCFYISHRAEALALADYRIVFSPEGVVIE